MNRTFLQNLCVVLVFLSAAGLMLWLGLRQGKTVSMETWGVELSQKESWENAIQKQPAEEQPSVVYVTKSGEKYHASTECSSLKRSKNILQTQKSAAEQQGKTPCALCYGS